MGIRPMMASISNNGKIQNMPKIQMAVLHCIKSDGENITSIKKMFLKRDETYDKVSKNFHTLDCQNRFIGIEITYHVLVLVQI